MDLRAESTLAKQTISTDIFLSPLPISDWLTFCCGNLKIQRKENEKNKFCDENQQKMLKKYI